MFFQPSRTAALERLNDFLPRAGSAYANNRNHDDGTERTNVSQLSPWLHAGLVSEAEVVDAVLSRHSPSSVEKFISEVFWRVYFKGYLEQRPTIWRSYCSDRDTSLAALESNAGQRQAYSEAVEGRTGIEAFDRWAHELVETGYLHNHARMWFASIWIFTLKLDWQLGADFFLRHLIDGDAASNTLSWRWIGGLHTKGKTYLARPENIARYTANHPQGPLEAEGLADHAPTLEEGEEHSRKTLELPGTIPSNMLDDPYALILHDEAASHVPLGLPKAPALVIGAARPEARSPDEVGASASDYAMGAVRSGLDEAAAKFGCETREWDIGSQLSDILKEARVQRVVVPYLPTGWTRDTLMPELEPVFAAGRGVTLIDDLNRATWPHAKAGFFGVKKKIDGILRELAINGAREPELPNA